MKTKLFLIIGLIAAAMSVINLKADSIPNEIVPPAVAKPVNTVVDYLSANTNALTATNWSAFAAYSRITGGTSKSGGTLGAVYYWSQYVGTQIRFQYIDTGKTKWMLPNGTITLQSSYRPFGQGFPLTLRPLLELGAATDMNGHLYAIAGGGSEVDIYSTHNAQNIIQRISAFYGWEKWEGQNQELTVKQYGLAVNLNATKIIAGVTGLFHK